MVSDQEKRGVIDVTIGERKFAVSSGTLVSDLLTARKDQEGRSYLAAIVNNRLVDLETPLFGPSKIQPVTMASREGASVYRRTATLVLYQAFRDLFPNLRIVVGQSLGYGYHFRAFIGDKEEVLEEKQLKLLEERMKEIVNDKRPIKRELAGIEEAKLYFETQNMHDKVLLLKTWRSWDVRLVSCGTYRDIQHGPVAPTTQSISGFSLKLYAPGFVLEFPSVLHQGPEGLVPFKQKTLFNTYQETKRWNEILGVSTVGQLNEHCLNGGVGDIIRVTEGFHEKKVAEIADKIAARRDTLRVILVAGPSASGKTTFVKRLGVQLRVNGIRPFALSMDNYYVNREDTPRHPDGSYDFEAMEAVDLKLFNEHLVRLLAGETVFTPVFDFHQGKRMAEEKWKPIRLAPDQMVMIEGIHGLNPRFTEAIDNSQKFKIFANALTQLCLDHSNRIFTSESRLLRRIVRDRRYRGYSAAQTIDIWPSVRLGERRHIYPFQEEADVMFNSALVYEPAVLKVFAERYLFEVPRDHPSAVTAHSLLKFLELFVPILPNDVAHNSILREFIGGSRFNYK